MVRGKSPGPAPAAHARASNRRLTRSSGRTCPHRKLRRKVPRVDGALTTPENTDRPTSTQRISVVDEVAARQRGSDQRQQFVPRVRPPRCAAEVEVMVDEFPQAQVLCGWPAGGRHWPTVKDDADTVGIILWQATGTVFCFKTILEIQTTLWLLQGLSPKSWIRAKVGS